MEQPPVGSADDRRKAASSAAPAGTQSGAGDTHAPASARGTDELPEQFGRYRILRKLGEGGMGAVYLARDTHLEREVALKVPRFSAQDGPPVIERFCREARMAAMLHHPNICPVHDVGEHHGIHYLTMAYIEGRPLSQFVAASQRGERFSERNAAAIIRKIALALHEPHGKGIVHRDLKPANILIDQRREPVVMDFGLARRTGAADVRLTQTGTVLGTPAYMAPEQVLGEPDRIGPACDIYSLGVILYELLTGRLPFDGPLTAVLGQIIAVEPEPPSRYRPGLSRRLEAVCLKAMAKQIERRYGSMAEVAAALTECLRYGAPAATCSSDSRPTSEGLEDRTEPDGHRRDSPAPNSAASPADRSQPRHRARGWSIRGGIGAARRRTIIATSAAAALAIIVGLIVSLRGPDRINDLDEPSAGSDPVAHFSASPADVTSRVTKPTLNDPPPLSQLASPAQELELIEKSEAELESEREWFRRMKLWHGWLTSGHSDHSRMAITELEQIADPDAVSALTRYFADGPRKPLRLLYVDVLTRIPGPKPVAALARQSLYDVDREVRYAALNGLKPEQYETAMPYYVRELKNSLSEIVVRAGTALERVGNEQAVPYLIDALVTTHEYHITQLPAGQLPNGVIVNPLLNQTQPMKTVTVKRQQQNLSVLDALTKLTGQNFGYDERTWRLWHNGQKTGAISEK